MQKALFCQAAIIRQRWAIPLAERGANGRRPGSVRPQGIGLHPGLSRLSALLLCRADVDRAVLNLLDNAARFTPAGGAIRLEADVAGHVLTVAVTDTGLGFSPEALARAGKELFTGDTSRPQDGHMGLGLCFARQVAVRHGGELALSNTGTGARAALTLPLAEP